MKTTIFSFTFLFIFALSAFAQLPYSKMMNLSREQLIEKKFKFDQKKNQYVLTKTDGLNTTLGVLTALSGQATAHQPSKKDYSIVLQYGMADSLSSLTAIFYSDDTFNEIQTWIAENNIQPFSSGSGKVSIQKFTYDSLNVELRSQAVIQSAGQTTANRYAVNSNSIDKSYTLYTYTIYTGVEPFSEWHTKQQAKKNANKAKGKKEDLNDLF
ncbi:MAG: hypothetical protein JXR27_00940 [Paludibacteraceae bacterium]|nr:hypothetical protein [Paludibacteraceae bacterium]